MENFKKNVNELTHRVATRDLSHPFADLQHLKANVEHVNSGGAEHPAITEFKKRKLP